MHKPNFFIVGAAKCGTTSMFEYLRQHPEIAMSTRKEPHYFAPDLQWQWAWRISDEKKYLALFRHAGSALRVGEGSTWHLYSSQAAVRIKEFAPDAKIIAMVRNPVDMIYSLYGHSVRNGNEDMPNFSAALDAEDDRRRGRRVPEAAPFRDCLFYRSVPRYAEQIQRYFDVFGRAQVLVIIFDDLAEDAAREYRRVIRFLEVDESFAPEFVVANAASAPPGLPFPRFLRMHRRFHRFLQVTTPLALRRGAGKILLAFHRNPARPLRMEPKLRAELIVHFAPEVQKLGNLLERDLSHWSRSEGSP